MITRSLSLPEKLSNVSLTFWLWTISLCAQTDVSLVVCDQLFLMILAWFMYTKVTKSNYRVMWHQLPRPTSHGFRESDRGRGFMTSILMMRSTRDCAIVSAYTTPLWAITVWTYRRFGLPTQDTICVSINNSW